MVRQILRAFRDKAFDTGLMALQVATHVKALRCADTAIRSQILDQFYRPEVGMEYGISHRMKKNLVGEFRKTTQSIKSGTSWLCHVVLADAIFRVPRAAKGVIVECGCWKGASTANLSLACQLVGRKLIACDSFEGLPEDKESSVHRYPHLGVYGYYEKGMYAGRLEEVEDNIRRFGHHRSCEFIKGFFSDSLSALTEPVALAFLDVDLLASLQDCIRAIWPLLIDNGYVFTDDSADMDVVKTWFQEDWWRRELGVEAPGYVGSGCGVMIDARGSSLGYAQKVTDASTSYGRIHWLRYRDQLPAKS